MVVAAVEERSGDGTRPGGKQARRSEGERVVCWIQIITWALHWTMLCLYVWLLLF